MESSVKSDIISILKEIEPSGKYNDEVKLISDGIIDSVDLFNLVMELENRFDIEIPPESLTEKSFDRINDIANLIISMKGGR